MLLARKKSVLKVHVQKTLDKIWSFLNEMIIHSYLFVML